MNLSAIIAVIVIIGMGRIQLNATAASNATDKEQLIQIERDLAVAWPKGDKETID